MWKAMADAEARGHAECVAVMREHVAREQVDYPSLCRRHCHHPRPDLDDAQRADRLSPLRAHTNCSLSLPPMAGTRWAFCACASAPRSATNVAGTRVPSTSESTTHLLRLLQADM